jgi:hypothetical protein
VRLDKDTAQTPKAALVHSQYDFRFFCPEDGCDVDPSTIDQFLAFTSDYLLVAKTNSVKYVKVPEKVFQYSKGDVELEPYYLPGNPDKNGSLAKGQSIEEVNFMEGVKIL